MRALIQRVTHAQVDVDGRAVGSIGTGLLILLGVGTNDPEEPGDKKGNRPSFTDSGAPAEANRLYELFVSQARKDVPRVETGEFGAMMEVLLVNDGPFTLWLDTDEL